MIFWTSCWTTSRLSIPGSLVRLLISGVCDECHRFVSVCLNTLFVVYLGSVFVSTSSSVPNVPVPQVRSTVSVTITFHVTSVGVGELSVVTPLVLWVR